MAKELCDGSSAGTVSSLCGASNLKHWRPASAVWAPSASNAACILVKHQNAKFECFFASPRDFSRYLVHLVALFATMQALLCLRRHMLTTLDRPGNCGSHGAHALPSREVVVLREVRLLTYFIHSPVPIIQTHGMRS